MGNVALSYCFSNVYVVEYNTRDLFHSLLCPLLAEGWDSGGVGQEKWVSATRGSFYACSYQKTLLSIGLAISVHFLMLMDSPFRATISSIKGDSFSIYCVQTCCWIYRLYAGLWFEKKMGLACAYVVSFCGYWGNLLCVQLEQCTNLLYHCCKMTLITSILGEEASRH